MLNVFGPALPATCEHPPTEWDCFFHRIPPPTMAPENKSKVLDPVCRNCAHVLARVANREKVSCVRK